MMEGISYGGFFSGGTFPGSDVQEIMSKGILSYDGGDFVRGIFSGGILSGE